ncbi:hypothetical protein JB92DRAFT_1246481 [Gautieria morchelliformis]|nr:hypothetical protein JB92DRAFT_1246481 [Gautieria morchelliformis]
MSDSPEQPGTCHIRFNADSDERAFWAERTGLHALNDEELDAAYKRAHTFIREDKERLINEHGWTETPDEDRHLFSLSSPESCESALLSFPTTFSSFVDPADSHMWKALFEQVFHAAQSQLSPDIDFFSTGPHPLCSMLYLLQCIAPGMLLLSRVRHFDEDEGEYIRILPGESWVDSHTDMLTTVLGTTTAYDQLLDASSDEDRSFFKEDLLSELDCHGFAEGSGLEQTHTWHGFMQLGYGGLDDDYFEDGDVWSSSDDVWDVGSAQDFTACSAEDCGYCGHCEY